MKNEFAYTISFFSNEGKNVNSFLKKIKKKILIAKLIKSFVS